MSNKAHATTLRQQAYLGRMQDGQGRRVVVDLNGGQARELDDLRAAGYAPTQVGIIRKAIAAAHAEFVRKTAG